MTSILFRTFCVLLLITLLPSTSEADLTVVVDFGNGEVTNSVTGVNSTTAGVTGLTAGITFDLAITANNFWSGTGVGAQNLGIGVAGGQANAGIDNNFNGSGGTSQTVTESLTVSVSNVAGAGTISVSIIDFGLLFGTDAGANTEYYSVDGGAATGLVSTPQTIMLAPGGVASFTVGSLDLDGTGSDSRYALDRITVNIETVPEPGSLCLIGIGLGGIFLRRRR